MKAEEDEGRISIGGWCIMNNHAHLLVKASLNDLAKAIKIICLKYAAYYNKKQKRIGPVFGDRYKSENIENDRYLLGVIRYIHNNPVKSGLVKEIQDYSWSSYNCYMENNNNISKQEKSFILELFANDVDSFINFHKQQDDNEYLEIKDDKEAYKIDAARNVIKDFFADKGIIDARELKRNPEWMDTLIKELRQNSRLSLRQIAELTELPLGIVYEKTLQ